MYTEGQAGLMDVVLHPRFVLDQGRIVERGRHQALVARGGLYARMQQLQSDDVGAVASAPQL